MYELFIASGLGSIVGIIAGCIPGVGMFVATAVLYAMLMDLEPAALIMFIHAWFVVLNILEV